ncbi:C45 family autoproteolytic acyltransferase/hydolase [Flavitalea sp.]|nr:C45 family peptidase [Flavitalea sp.]
MSNKQIKKPRSAGRKILRGLLYFLGGILILLLTGIIYLVVISKVDPPKIADQSSLDLKRKDHGDGLYTLNNSWFRKSKTGLYELYVEGSPYEMGVTNGKLTRELVVRQEDHFTEQINKMIPSNFYQHFLKYVIGWFNRKLDKNVSEEYKDEIYGVSASASDNYEYIGSKYQRILNYHAAHDIGHALQSMALVGCTSFGTWNDQSEDSTMIIGRNFDFYVGDKFAEDKIVAFYNPANGYKLMTVTWGGFVGAVSGMNEKGITITINAAKTDLPTGSATPVSLVAREILQYAKNIEEAIAITRKRKMFVSESFLVGSAADNKAVVIEKTPDSLDVYDPGKNYIVCANHFQSKGLGHLKSNEQQIQESASLYRYKRLMQLLDNNGKNTVEKTVNILRDRKGINNADIGMGNEKAINQLIAHHSIVFEPKKLIVWVSTSPWQLGQYIAYDLNKVFALKGKNNNDEIMEANLTIPADSFLTTRAFHDFEKYRDLRQLVAADGLVNTDSLVASNPNLYHTYVLAGDYSFAHGEFEKARAYYKTALTKVIATKAEEDHIHEQLRKIEDRDHRN